VYSLTIRDYLKCAHSLKGEIFGPARLMHVITYEVEVGFLTAALDEYGLIVDFASAQRALQDILGRLNFKNLDTVRELDGENTTTEFLCRWLHDQLAEEMAGKFAGTLRVTLRESPVAWTTYEAALAVKASAAKGRRGR
jgi:6-pyruvoyl-tetrahydropterin synthase